MKLIIEDDEGRKTVVPIVRDEIEITIGRQEGNTIRLTERNVSRHHAKLVRHTGQVLIEDLNSYNGIKVNGDRITGALEIREGDLVQIGDYDLAIQEDERPPSENGAAEGLPDTTLSPVPELGDSSESSVPTIGKAAPPRRVTPAAASAAEPEPEDEEPPPPRAEVLRRAQAPRLPREIADIPVEQAPRLVLTAGELAGREYACIRTELKIGSGEDDDIAILHPGLSRGHFKLLREAGEWRILDLLSSGGIKINGEPYAEGALRFGDALELGPLAFDFLGPGEDSAPVGADTRPLPARTGSPLPLFLGAGVALLVAAAVAGLVYRRLHPPARILSRPEPTPAATTPAPPPAPEPAPAPPPTPEPVAAATPPPEPTPVPRAAVPLHAVEPRAAPVASALPGATGAAKARPPGARGEEPRGKGAHRAAAPEKTARELYLEGMELKKGKMLADAVERFEAAIRLDPLYADAHFNLAVTLGEAGNRQGAIERFQIFARQFPDDPRRELALANVQTLSGASKEQQP